MVGTVTTVDLARLTMVQVRDRQEYQNRRESDREMRRQGDKRIRTQILEELDRREAVVRAVPSFAGVLAVPSW